MNTPRQQKKSPNGKVFALFFVLWLVHPGLLFFAIIGYAIYTVVKQNKPAQAAVPARPVRSARQVAFDDCPKPLFCFHKDKGEHHVRRGKEIDPWDRPDIDISKYQRRG